MPLLWRLTLTFAAALAVVLSGMGVTLFSLLERDLRGDFVRDLAVVARTQARMALREDRVALTRLAGTALHDELGEPQAFLLRADGSLVESLVDAPAPRLPQPVLTRANGGQTVTFVEGERRPQGWRAAFTPTLTAHTRIVAHPIYGFEGGRLQVAYLLALRAEDTGTVAALRRMRAAVLSWLAGGLVFSGLVGFLLARVIAAPVTAMARTAQAVQDGDLSARAPGGNRGDELGALARNLNAMLERLGALVTAQRRFTADAAHDLRTPLTVLRGEVDLALRRERGAAEYREALERMRGDLAGLSALAEDLLTLARLEGSELRDQAAAPPVPLAEVLTLPLRTAEGLARQRGRSLRVELPPDLWVRADPALLARATLNLLSNALIHGGDTRFQARQVGGRVELLVQDDGPGVPHNLRRAVFTRFARGEGSGGTGLGLAITREVARVHGGTLTYHGPPAGPSTFILRLPQRRSPDPFPGGAAP